MEQKVNAVIEKRDAKAEIKRFNGYIKGIRKLEQKTKNKEDGK